MSYEAKAMAPQKSLQLAGFRWARGPRLGVEVEWLELITQGCK
jgi:hypothetical protein